ncbi:TPM domain-containing protein [Bacillus sp. FSL K6-3431]|uniref:TPM domain-containing protein n=1 Tax=Bacillus sp. FSL K6-3431 TaxID=2921500 RepID=UPI0030F88BE6
MKTKICVRMGLFLIAILLIIPVIANNTLAANETKQHIYDSANLLNQDEIENLEEMANKYSAKRKTDFIILTTNDTEGKDIVPYMQDFYDENAPGYDKPHGNTVILTIDMQHKDVEVAGFYKGEKYLDNERATLVREKITPDLSNENYEQAFQTFITTSYNYMGIKPGISPDNILFNIWFQIIASLALAGMIVGVMVYNSGGKKTINEKTYRDINSSKVLQRKDTYIRTSTSKRKKPSNNSSSGGGRSGGGVTGGGHSHSGSRGSF